MGIGTEVFTMPGSKFKAICLNPVEDPEKIKEISQRYYEGLVNALEITLGKTGQRKFLNKGDGHKKIL